MKSNGLKMVTDKEQTLLCTFPSGKKGRTKGRERERTISKNEEITQSAISYPQLRFRASIK